MIKFNTVELRNPDRGDSIETTSPAKVQQDYTGALHLARKAIQTGIKLQFDWMPASQGAALYAFFISKKNDSFTYTDYLGVAHTVQFNMDTLELKYDGNNDVTGIEINLLEV